MNDTIIPPSATRTRSAKGKYLFLLALIIGVAAALTATLCVPRYWLPNDAENAQKLAQIEQRLTGLENSVHALDERLNNLSAPPAATAALPAASDMSALKEQVALLATTLTTLQSQLKDSANDTAQKQKNVQNILLALAAFADLRSIAASSQPFTAELAALNEASSTDTDLQNLLARLQPVAAEGAATRQDLEQGLQNLEAAAGQVNAPQTTQEWWKKILAHLQSLISVKRLHTGTDSVLSAMEKDVSRNDFAAALASAASLSPETQNLLQGWIIKAQARQVVNQTLRDISEHFRAALKKDSQ